MEGIIWENYYKKNQQNFSMKFSFSHLKHTFLEVRRINLKPPNFVWITWCFCIKLKEEFWMWKKLKREKEKEKDSLYRFHLCRMPIWAALPREFDFDDSSSPKDVICLGWRDLTWVNYFEVGSCSMIRFNRFNLTRIDSNLIWV